MAVIATHPYLRLSALRIVTEAHAMLAPACYDRVRFSAQPATHSPKQPAEKLGFFKSLTQQVVSFLLGCLPKSLYRWAESRTLYGGSKIPTLKITLEEIQKNQSLSSTEKELLSSFQEVRFLSSQAVNHYGWYFPAKAGKSTFVLSMGNAWSLADMLNYASLMQKGYGFLAYEYPGHGSTPGSPTEVALYQSLEAASDFLEKEKGIPVFQQIAYGVSLGGAVATHVATNRSFKALILESTMTNFPDVVKAQVSKILPSWLLPLHEHVDSKLDSLSKINRIKCPLLVMSGTADPLMPQEFAKALYEKAASPQEQKMLKLYPVGDHSLDPSLSIEGIREFLDKLA